MVLLAIASFTISHMTLILDQPEGFSIFQTPSCFVEIFDFLHIYQYDTQII